MLDLDPWQREILDYSGDICVRSGRQVGKSTIISIKAAHYALLNPNKTILIISAVERQAFHLFEMTLDYLYNNYKRRISTGKNKPTKHKIHLTNGSVIWCLPTGLTGYGIRGYTINLLIADEAAFIPEEVWTAVTPMLAVTKGQKILISTPHGKEGYYYECFNDPSFKSYHISSEECPRISKDYLKREKEKMTKVEYAQEYMGEFVDELRQFFSTELIKSCLTLQRGFLPSSHGEKFCGVDVARMGGDDSVIITLNRNKDNLMQTDMKIMNNHLLTELVREIKRADENWNYKRIYIDDGGLGVGVFDPLLEDEQTKRKVEAINNSRRSIEWDAENPHKKRLMKEDLYSNLLHLMEAGKLKLFDDPEIMLSLKSIQVEYDDDKRMKIFGKYTHITEALIRAAWCVKDKHLNIWVRWR